MRFALILLLSGCASVFDAPEPLLQVKPVEYRSHWDKTPVLCEYWRGGRWTMMVPRNECLGWTPI